MPKERRTPTTKQAVSAMPYPTASSSEPRNPPNWLPADDEILLQARRAGMNWQEMAKLHFPQKTPNACRKRHERLVEKRQMEDWDVDKLERLGRAYDARRQQMWEPLAKEMGEKWQVVEAKCLEKGLKGLKTPTRTGNRKGPADSVLGEDRGNLDHTDDSGVCLSCSDAEMEADHVGGLPARASTWHAHADQEQSYHQDHIRTRSLPQPLRLYQPPAPVIPARRHFDGTPVSDSPSNTTFGQWPSQRCSPESQNGRNGMSIQSVLSTD